METSEDPLETVKARIVSGDEREMFVVSGEVGGVRSDEDHRLAVYEGKALVSLRCKWRSSG